MAKKSFEPDVVVRTGNLTGAKPVNVSRMGGCINLALPDLASTRNTVEAIPGDYSAIKVKYEKMHEELDMHKGEGY